jgi:hypothetical protein
MPVIELGTEVLYNIFIEFDVPMKLINGKAIPVTGHGGP